MIIVRPHLDHVAWIGVFDSLKVGRRSDQCTGGKGEDDGRSVVGQAWSVLPGCIIASCLHSHFIFRTPAVIHIILKRVTKTPRVILFYNKPTLGDGEEMVREL